MGFSPFHEPFGGSSGAGTIEGVPEPYQAAIGSHLYVVEPRKSGRRYIGQLRPAADQSDEPGEHTLNPEMPWRVSQSSWHLGAGQVWLDSSKDADKHRFRASKGIDVWTPFALTQLPSAGTKKLAATNTNLRLIADPASHALWVIDGVNVKVTTNPDNAAPTFSTCTGLPGVTITSATFTGAHIYVVANAVVYRCAVGSTVFASWYAGTSVDGVQYANGRLFGWRAALIFELTAAAAKVDLFTHPQSTWTWDVVVGAPNAVYMAGHNGYSSEIYRTDVRDATGTLTAPISSATLIDERVTAAIAEAGYIILATKRADEVGTIRLCAIINSFTSTGGSLDIGPGMFSQLGQKPTGPIDALYSTGRFVYFSWKNLDSTCTGTGRLDLQTFTQPRVPAYATDQMAGVTGATVQGAVLGLVVDSLYGQTWFAVSGVGVYGTTASTYMDANYLYSGRIRYGILDPKVLSSAFLRCETAASTETKMHIMLDDGTELAVVIVDGDTGPESPIVLTDNKVEWCEVEITMTSHTSTAPVLDWWVLSGIPVPGSTEQIVLAVILRDIVYVGPSETQTSVEVDVDNELDYLRTLRSSRTITTLRMGDRLESVYVNDIIQQEPERFSPYNDHFEGLVLVELRTVGT